MFLSGGIDSTLVTALLQKDSPSPLKTFTIGFHEKEYNEANWAKKVAEHLGTDHTELYCTTQEAFDIIPKLADLYDEPFGDSSAIPTYLVSQLAKEQVKVSLSADGGDEQFCGYNRYWNTINVMNKLDKLPMSSMIPTLAKWVNPDLAFAVIDRFTALMPKTRKKIFKDKFIKFRDFVNTDHYLTKYDMIYKFFLPQELEGLGIHSNLTQVPLMDKRVENLDIYGQSMFYDLKTYLTDDILTKVDRATMGVSLEGREPFLDNRILEYSSRMPMKYKYRDGQSKWVLRKILEKYVPNEYFERKKQGFSIPIYEWFKNDMKDLYYEQMNPDRIKRDGVLNPAPIKKMLDDYMKGRGVYPFKLWFLFIFQLWYEKHMR
jgi:asparagine synthase (glutamine-hydrolysing)